MSLTVGSNIFALRAIRSVQDSTDEISTIFERLSTGQRINRASDDAAGLAIADSLRSDERLYGQSVRNINDGISVLNIIDAALSAQGDILTRLQELATQSANGSYSNTERAALDDEYFALVEEFGRIGEAAEFNGRKLLESSQTTNIQAGITSALSSLIGLDTSRSGTGYGDVEIYADFDNPTGLINSLDFFAFTSFISGPPSLDEMREFFGPSALRFDVTDSEGNTQTVYGFWVDLDLPGFNTLVLGSEEEGYIDLVDLDSGLSQTVALNFDNAGTTGSLSFDLSGYNTFTAGVDSGYQQSALEFTGVDSSARALNALDVLSARLESLNAMRGEIGALQSRLSSAVRVAETQRLASKEAEDRIRSADVASEATKLVAKQLIQQAATSVLAQANLQPGIALQLLGNLQRR